MNVFETYIRKNEEADKKYADLAIQEIREKLKDQILFLKENSKDESIRNHLRDIDKENKENLLSMLDDKDIIDFNEVVLKGNWREYLDKKRKEDLTKSSKIKDFDKLATIGDVDKEGTDPDKNFKLTFRAMINHYATDLEIEDYQKKKESERKMLKTEFENKLLEIGKNKPHIVAEIKTLDLDVFRKPDYLVVMNLDEKNFGDYEKGLKEYFGLKISSKAEERSLQQKAEMIMKDQRFRYYCALRELLGIEGHCSPEIFLKN